MNLLVADAPPVEILAVLQPAVDVVRADATRLARRAEAARIAPIAQHLRRDYSDRHYSDGLTAVVARFGTDVADSPITAMQTAVAEEDECDHEDGVRVCSRCGGRHPDDCYDHSTECPECDGERNCPECDADPQCGHSYTWECCDADGDD